ncbi:MAG: histidine phosphatase family protein [Candidatus Rokuibacteriota bacterium]
MLIRHGETPGNAERIVQTADVPLSPRGMVQAERLAQRLQRTGIARILSSDLVRATMTAEYLRRATGVPIQLDPLLQERSFGEIRGTPYDQLRVDIFAPDYRPPGGESWEIFHARVDRAWELIGRVAAETEGHLAVVTHGLVCRSLAARHLILADGQEAPMRWANTGLTVADGPVPWRVRLLNCSAHLDGDLADRASDAGPA